jgi:predicted dehydrogenase
MSGDVKPVSVLVVGAGGRGAGYAGYAKSWPDRMKIAGVAEPRADYRAKFAADHGLAAGTVFADWREAVARERLADAVLIATPDALHAAPALAFIEKGYHVLLEKPMAPNEADCRAIAAAALARKIVFAVCHVSRYTVYTRAIKKAVDAGTIGRLLNIQILEPVGYWHQAHSFVRGNWRNERLSSFMLLAKSCHDLDWIRYVMGRRCTKASSFGGLSHFRKDQKPAEAGAALRCTDCAHEPACAYSARKIYVERAERGEFGWPVDVLSLEHTVEAVKRAVKEGPYGRCVYECDNDVVDHQVVNLEFEDGATAAFSMVGLTEQSDRKTKLFGTKGQIVGDGRTIEIYDFLTDKKTVTGGHGGGDGGVVDNFLAAVAANDPSMTLSGPRETLESHLMVFAAEQSRREGRIVEVNPG